MLRRRLIALGFMLFLSILFIPRVCLSRCDFPRVEPTGWNWRIRIYLYPKELYLGVRGYAKFEMENTGDTELYIYRIWLQWDWQGDLAYFSDTDVYIKPGEIRALGKVYFSIPEDISAGYHLLRVGVSQKHKTILGWWDDGLVWSQWSEIKILNPPLIEIISCVFDKPSITVGEAVNLVVKIKNFGEATARDIC